MPPFKGHGLPDAPHRLPRDMKRKAQRILERPTKVNESEVKLALFHLTDTLKDCTLESLEIKTHEFIYAPYGPVLPYGHKFYYRQNITELAKQCETMGEVMLTVYYWFELAMERDLRKRCHVYRAVQHGESMDDALERIERCMAEQA